jgi:two-component system CheB/CheR fusion protein
VVIDANHDVLRFYGDTGRFLGPSTGTASLNVFNLLHKGLRGPARTAVQQALANHTTVVQEGQLYTGAGERVPVRLIAEPIAALDDAQRKAPANLCLLVFKETTPPVPASDDEGARRPPRGAESRRVQELETELANTREQLHTAIEELESANEEMKSANEEYQSVNEELQSSNEELETSKEEMQSINEELQTVNAELHSKNEVLARLNSDLQNLLESTQIATLFLDPALHVSGFTPAISDLFHLREGDRGRPITEITARIAYPELRQDVQQVLRTLAMVERVLQGSESGAVYLMRMRPYRTTDNVIDGVVLTFIDITERQQHEYARGRLAAIVESSQDAIIGHDANGVVSSWNAGAERMFGYPPGRMLGKPLALLLPPEHQDAVGALLAACTNRASSEELLMDWRRQDGTLVSVSARCSPILDPEDKVIGGSTIVRDISERRRAQRRLDESERQLATIVEQTTVGIAKIDLAGRFEIVNPRFCDIVGRPSEELVGQRVLDITHPDDVAANDVLLRELFAGGRAFQVEKRYLRGDGSPVWVSSHVSLIHDDDGRPRGAVAVVLDISERKAAAEQRELLLSELNHRVKNTLATVQAIALQTLAGARDLQDFRTAFLSRLMGLAKTHNLLAREHWRGASLRELVAAELAPYTHDAHHSAEIEGDPLVIEPKTALALSLALHELATNAGKYGALSAPGGGVRVSWQVDTRDDGRWLRLVWQEHGGPPVAPPAQRGFGTRLVGDGVPHELGGQVDLDFAATGVRCTIAFPLRNEDAP